MTEKRAKILNVNDNEAARYVLSRILGQAGFDVLEAVDGTQALETAARAMPAAMVLDVRLPDIDGFEVCRRLKRAPETAGIKVILTSATFVTPENKVEGLDAGADGYLIQPFEPPELIASIQSLLRLHEVEEQLRSHAASLVEADRRKDDFLAMLAHELRNPLAAVAASLPLLKSSETDAVRGRAREVIERQVGHLSRLVEDLLDVARITHGKIALRRKPVSLNRLLQNVVRQAGGLSTEARGQHLTLVLPETDLQVEGDAERLEQVFGNLVDNASKYTDRGGSIAVTLSTAQEGATSKARVSIRDTGIGIAPLALPGIFGLFTQANASIDRSRGGLGIGLTVVRKLVELHGGQVSASSEGLDRGSEFRVDLPLMDALVTPAPPPTAARQSSARLRPRRKVVLVEDNIDLRQPLADLCTLWGHDVVVAADGLQGIAAIRDHRPDIALIDIGLPGLNGFEVARRLREDPATQQTLLVALTGYGSPEQRLQALDAGFAVHLTKPADTRELESLLVHLAPRSSSGPASLLPSWAEEDG